VTRPTTRKAGLAEAHLTPLAGGTKPGVSHVPVEALTAVAVEEARSTQGLANSSRASYDDVCKACGKRSHWAKDCRSRPRKEQVHVAQDNE
jgi:hypothetical protein